MPYALADLPIQRQRNFSTQRNICGAITAALLTVAYFYVKHEYALHGRMTNGQIAIYLLIATTLFALATVSFAALKAVMRIDDKGFYYYFMTNSQYYAWDDIKEIDRKRVVLGQGTAREGIKIVRKTENPWSGQKYVFDNFDFDQDALAVLLRDCVARYGQAQPLERFPDPGMTRSSDNTRRFGKRQPNS